MGVSKIEWTDCTLNPIKARRKDTGKVGWHCEKISPACANCYACTFNRRNLPNGGTGLDYVRASRDQVGIFLDLDVMRQPLHWKKPRRIFVCSMTDIFAEFVPDDMVAEIWRLMQKTPRHTYQVLTKRADRMGEILPRLVATFGVLENAQLGVTAENQEFANLRIPFLLRAKAAVRFVSYEPALGGIDLCEIELPSELPIEKTPAIINVLTEHDDEHFFSDHAKLDWVIAGGESGSKARPSHPDWFRRVRNQCQTYGIPFFFKQWGSHGYIDQMPDETVQQIDAVHNLAGHPDGGKPWNVGKKAAGRSLDGEEWSEFPENAFVV
jgi:protein gp37